MVNSINNLNLVNSLERTRIVKRSSYSRSRDLILDWMLVFMAAAIITAITAVVLLI